MSVPGQNVVKYKIAHVKIKGADMIIIPLDSSFAEKRSEEKSDIFNTFQRHAASANLKGMIVLVWDCGGKMAYLSAKQAHPYLQGLTISTVHNNLNKELAIKSQIACAEAFSDSKVSAVPSSDDKGRGMTSNSASLEREDRPAPASTAPAPPEQLDARDKVAAFQRKHRIGLVTLLFTDMVGSTKLKQELGDAEAVRLMQKHHSLMRDVLRLFPGGEEISTAGDSFFIVFAKPSDAVRFSLIVQSKLRKLSEEVDYIVADRIGVHVGEVFIEEMEGSDKVNDLYGIQVDTAARVMSLGEANQILMTRFAFDNARQVLKGQELDGIGLLTWKSHGLYDLKGVEEPLEVCEVGEAGFASLKAPEASEKVRRHTPMEATPRPAAAPQPQVPASKHVVGTTKTSYQVSPIRFSSVGKGSSS
jgi:class 3 adenylate cyclase